MRFIKYLSLGIASLVAACGNRPVPPSPPLTSASGGPATPAPLQPASPSATAAAPTTPTLALPARNWDEYKLRVARRIMQANADATFQGEVPQRLQSIPVLQIELNRDGSVRHINVLRTPKFSPQTLQMAMAAVRKAGPFDSVAHLPRPWHINETFLYNDDLKFQLRTLVEAQ